MKINVIYSKDENQKIEVVRGSKKSNEFGRFASNTKNQMNFMRELIARSAK